MGVEREVAGLELAAELEAAGGAGAEGAVLEPRPALDQHGDPPVGSRGRLLHRVRDPGAGGGREGDSIDDEINLHGLLEGQGLVIESALLPVDHDPDEAGGGPAGDQRGQAVGQGLLLGGRAAPMAVDGSEDPALRLAAHLLAGLEDLACHLRRVGGLEDLAVVRAPRSTSPREEDAQLVVDLRGGRDRGARVPANRARLHGDRGAEARDGLDGWLVLGAEELARVGGQGLDEASPALRVDGVQGQARLPRARWSRHDGERAPRDVDIHSPEVVRPGASDGEMGRLLDAFRAREWLRAQGAPADDLAQGGPGRRVLVAQLLGGSEAEDLSAPGSALGPEVDQVVGGLDELEVVLDHEDGVPLVDQPLEGPHQPPHVLHVQPRRGLVQKEQGLTLGSLRQVGHQLDALGFPPGERRRGLAEGQVPEAHVHHQPQRSGDEGVVVEELDSVLHGHREHVGDGPLAVAHVEGLLLEALPAALLARNGDRAQELELHDLHARAEALLAPTACDVEAEARLGVAAHLRLGEAREEVANGPEDLGVGRRIGARGPADGRSGDRHEIVDLLEPDDAVVCPRIRRLALQMPQERALQGSVHQGGLAGAGDAGDGCQCSEGNRRVDALQVEGTRPVDRDDLAVPGSALVGRRDVDETAKEPARRGVHLVGRDDRRRPRRHDLSASTPGRGADVDEPVGAAQGGLVVLHHDHAVAGVTELREGSEEPAVIPCVQPDARLVQDVEDALQSGAELRGEANPLRLTSGEGVRAPVEREVAQAHLHEELRPSRDLGEEIPGDPGLALTHLRPAEQWDQLLDRSRRELGKTQGPEPNEAGELVDATPLALGADLLRAEALHHLLARALLPGALELAEHATEHPVPAPAPLGALAVPLQRVPVALGPGAVKDRSPGDGAELSPGRV